MITTNMKSLKKLSLNLQHNLLLHSSSYFSTDILNHRVPLRNPSTGKLNDQFIHRYHNPMFSAYLEKRRLKRSQIWPKIHILEQPATSQLPHIKSQKLFQVKKLLQDDLIKKIIKEDTSQINSIFVISLFSEDNFKQLIDEYVNKVLVCGKAPVQQSQKYTLQLQTKVLKLYRNFYFGEKITPLQREIQINYLAAKQNKFLKKQIMQKNVHLSCNWTQQDQRLIQDFVNWQDTNLNLSDLNYRTYYERLQIFSRLPHIEKFHQLIGGDAFLQRLSMKQKLRKNFTPSDQSMNWIKEKLFSRTIQYTKCLQFTHMMKIPPDFTVQFLIFNIHIWLILDRLKQFNSKNASTVARFLQKMFQQHVVLTLGNLNINKVAITTKNFQQLFANARNALNMHFNVYQTTKANPYLNIDALVWSIAFKQKTERYSDEVYRVSEYLVRNWQNMKNFTQQDFLDGICQFDSYLIDADYKQKIQAINPQVSKQQFEQQFKSNKENKKYYYKSLMIGTKYNIQFKENNHEQDLKYSFVGALLNKIIIFMRKYMSNMENFDHFSEMDEQKKRTQVKDKKSPWKTETDRVKQTAKEFRTISQIKNSRKNDTSNIQSASKISQANANNKDKNKTK